MLKYLYTDEYNEPTDESGQLCSRLLLYIQIYNLADKYDVSPLMKLMEKKFKSMLRKGPTAEEYLAVVCYIYDTPQSTETFQPIVISHARIILRDLMQSDNVGALQATLHDIPEFAFDVLRLFVDAPLSGHCQTCGPNQAAEPLQARCISCGKGGISLSQSRSW